MGRSQGWAGIGSGHMVVLGYSVPRETSGFSVSCEIILAKCRACNKHLANTCWMRTELMALSTSKRGSNWIWMAAKEQPGLKTICCLLLKWPQMSSPISSNWAFSVSGIIPRLFKNVSVCGKGRVDVSCECSFEN